MRFIPFGHLMLIGLFNYHSSHLQKAGHTIFLPDPMTDPGNGDKEDIAVFAVSRS